jgi:hypothetical protein
MRDTVTKSDWLHAMQCLPGAWYGLREEISAPDEAARFRMEQGQEVGALARKLYPEGVMAGKSSAQSGAHLTYELINAGADTLFEPTFSLPPFTAKADVLKRVNGAWHVLEVKSSFSDTSQMDDLVDDLAYTVWILSKAGIRIGRASLLLLSREYRFGGSPEQLFEVVDKTPEAITRAAEFEEAKSAMLAALFSYDPPKAKLSSACRQCKRFGNSCLHTDATHTVLEIPQLHHTKLKKLSDAGVIDLADVPADLKLNERQQRMMSSALSGNIVVEASLEGALAAVVWPCHYLDFETIATVLPLYPGHGCHKQILTQFSIHHREGMDSKPTHSEYLADPSRDCERELAEALIAAVGDRGSVIVYSDFEEKRIKALQESYPDLANRLDLILGRLIDLLPIVRDHVYHPDFRGSFSIKHVLPALVPNLSYEGLDVRNGDMAITRFARMARGQIVGDAVHATRQHLLEYCKLDTFAMVSLHGVLDELASGERRAA